MTPLTEVRYFHMKLNFVYFLILCLCNALFWPCVMRTVTTFRPSIKNERVVNVRNNKFSYKLRSDRLRIAYVLKKTKYCIPKGGGVIEMS